MVIEVGWPLCLFALGLIIDSNEPDGLRCPGQTERRDIYPLPRVNTRHHAFTVPDRHKRYRRLDVWLCMTPGLVSPQREHTTV